LSLADEAREAARRCEGAGLLAEADVLYRTAVSLETAETGAAAASLARVLLACGDRDSARPLVAAGDDDVLAGVLALEEHEFSEARRLLDESRRRDPFDPRSASARGRLSFLEKNFAAAIADLLEGALLRPDGLPDAGDSRLLRAARALAPGLPPWSEAARAARERLDRLARERAPGSGIPDRVPALVRALISRAAAAEGVLERAARLAELPPLAAIDERALLAAAAAGELRRLPAGSRLYGAGEASGELFLVLSGEIELARDTPVGSQAMGRAVAADFAGEEALIGAPRTSAARAAEAATVLGFSPDSLFGGPERAAWLRYLRERLARRLAALNALFQDFFPDATPAAERGAHSTGDAVALTPEEKTRSLTSGGMPPSDRYLFAAFAEERRFAPESLIFAEGDPGDALYAIARGRVRISRHLAGGEEALAILGPGEIFGEMAILDAAATGRSADARAHEEATLLVLTRQRFEGLERADPEGCAELSAMLSRLAARRCVETAERLARWRVMAGPG
jgi:CRP/FNR family cyclic AMP-dependent transcriptional regulator